MIADDQTVCRCAGVRFLDTISFWKAVFTFFLCGSDDSLLLKHTPVTDRRQQYMHCLRWFLRESLVVGDRKIRNYVSGLAFFADEKKGQQEQ